MESFFSNITNWVLTAITGAIVWFFRELNKKQSIDEAREIEKRLETKIEANSRIIEKQQEFIYANVATKKDIEELKKEFKELSDKVNEVFITIAREHGCKRDKERKSL